MKNSFKIAGILPALLSELITSTLRLRRSLRALFLVLKASINGLNGILLGTHVSRIRSRLVSRYHLSSLKVQKLQQSPKITLKYV
jgi:hypothetical protein